MATIKKRLWSSRRELNAAKAEGRAPVKDREAWVVRYADQGGKWRLKTFDKKAEADSWLTDTKSQVKAGTHTPDSQSVTVAEAADLWLGRCEADNLESATLIQYRSHVTYHIKPLIGAERVSRLTMPKIEQFAADLLAGKDRKRSRVLVKKVVGSLKAMLKEAQRRGLVAQNVARDVTVKMNGRHNHKLKVGVDIPTKDEIKAVATDCTDANARALVFLAAFAGLRASELRGLAWSHVNFNNPTITIEERADERNRIGAPKSGAARRTIKLNATTATALREWKMAQRPIVTKDKDGKEIKRPGRLVFGTASDRPDGLANIRRRVFYPAMIKAGVAVPVLDKGQPVTDDKGQPVMAPKYTGLHCLRHFAVSSWLKTCGGDFKAVQTRAGHATLAMTLDTYGHLLDTSDDDQIAAAEKLVLG